jgi:hypothetical protein
MSTQTRNRVIEGPLSVVLRPDSEAAASYRSAVLAPGFGPQPGLDLRFFGGKTLPHLRYSVVYLGGWQAQERSELDHALAAAMRDRELNNVLAQYFPGTDVTTTFAGSKVHEGSRRSFLRSISAQRSPACFCRRAPSSSTQGTSTRSAASVGTTAPSRSTAASGTTRSPSIPRATTASSPSTSRGRTSARRCTTSCRRPGPIPTSRTRSAWGRRRAPTGCSVGTRRRAARSATSRWRKRAGTSAA